MRKVLITGITGFVGSHLADYLLDLEEEIDIYGLSRWRSPRDNIKHIEDKIHLVYGDLLDSHSIYKCLSLLHPDIIFHLAAQSYVPYSFQVPASTLDVNGLGTLNLLECVNQLRSSENYDPIVHICSSSEVYGQVDPKNVPIKEDCPFNPVSPYAVSKVTEDMLGLQYWISYGIKTIRTRMFTHTGPRRGEVFVVSNFAKQIVDIERGYRKSIVSVGNLTSIRTFADVRDTVKAYWLLVNKCPPGEVYNIGGSTTMTVGEMLQRLISFSVKKDIRIQMVKSRMRPSDATLQIPCIDKFKEATGWEPMIDFDTTLQDTLSYWREKL